MAGTGLVPGAATARSGGRGGLRRPLIMLGIANAALYALYVGVLQVLPPLQVQAIDPARKVAVLGLASGVTAVFATVFNPVGGALSDRTRSRFGHRPHRHRRRTRVAGQPPFPRRPRSPRGGHAPGLPSRRVRLGPARTAISPGSSPGARR